MRISNTRPTALLTLGRLPVALELSRALHAGGWRVLVADPYSWHLCRLSNTVDKSIKVTAPVTDAMAYRLELRQIIEQEQVGLVIPVSEETLYVASLKSSLPDEVKLICLDQRALLQLHDKYSFAMLASELGLPVPRTVLADNDSACAELTVEPYVLKPRFSCSGAGVRFGLSDDTLTVTEANAGNIVQQRLNGQSCSSFAIAYDGTVLISLCYRSLLDSGSVAVRFERMDTPDDVQRTVAGIVKATAYTGMIAFDFIKNDDDTWCVIECNPRATSGIHFVEPSSLLAMTTMSETTRMAGWSGRCQEFWSCLLSVEGALLRGKINRRGWAQLFTTRDITLRRTDLKPFFLMSFVMAPQLFKSLASGTSISEVLMSDVSWQND